MDLDRLISGFQRKEIAAFEQLYGMYADNNCGAIHQIVKNTGDADEICQDVFVKVWNNPDSYSASKGRFFNFYQCYDLDGRMDTTGLDRMYDGLAGTGMGIMHDAIHGSHSRNRTVKRYLGHTMNL